MSTSLEDDIRRAFARSASQTTIDPEPEFGRRSIVSLDTASRRSPRRVAVPAIAAAALVVVGGLVVISRSGPEPSARLAGHAPVDVSAAAVGLFPFGDRAAITAAGFASPQAAVDAYLADRTRPDVLPDGYEASYSVADRVVRTADDSAIVGFSLATVEDSGDGLLLTQQVAAPTEPERWVVLYGGISTFTIDELDYRDGRLTGSFTSEIGGHTEIGVYDAVTGERLGSATSNPFEVDGLSAAAVAVRFWNTVADGGYPIAVFAEALVHDGDNVTELGRDALADAYYRSVTQTTEPDVPFDTGPVSAFDDLEPGQAVSVLTDSRTTIDARVGYSDPSYCLVIEFGDRPIGEVCFTADDIAGQQNFFNVGSMDGTQVLVGGIVPDAVTQITSDTGEVITPIHNVWWDVIDAGRLATYTIATGDGRTIQTTIG